MKSACGVIALCALGACGSQGNATVNDWEAQTAASAIPSEQRSATTAGGRGPEGEMETLPDTGGAPANASSAVPAAPVGSDRTDAAAIDDSAEIPGPELEPNESSAPDAGVTRREAELANCGGEYTGCPMPVAKLPVLYWVPRALEAAHRTGGPGGLQMVLVVVPGG